METDQDPPFPREPWQRLLQDRADSPPETTDARIRVAARKVLAPRAARWWLPASLAASFLLAVLIVQLQFENGGKPAVVSEADLAAPAPMEAPATPAAESAPLQRSKSAPRIAPFERPPAEFAPEPEARVGGPEQDLKSANQTIAEESEAEFSEAPGPTDAAPVQAAPADDASVRATGARAMQSAAPLRTPEGWYAEIEALRKAGRIEEADAELARFEAAYPDWLKRHGQPRP